MLKYIKCGCNISIIYLEAFQYHLTGSEIHAATRLAYELKKLQHHLPLCVSGHC